AFDIYEGAIAAFFVQPAQGSVQSLGKIHRIPPSSVTALRPVWPDRSPWRLAIMTSSRPNMATRVMRPADRVEQGFLFGHAPPPVKDDICGIRSDPPACADRAAPAVAGGETPVPSSLIASVAHFSYSEN
ncbi:MAG: hypothetical protein WCD16_03100, partial [Paracoccaceae bacterium]